MTGVFPPIGVERLLRFAAAHSTEHPGRVDEAIRRELGISPARYFVLLGRAINTEEALRHDAVTTHRLRRLAEQRRRDRAARSTTFTTRGNLT